MKKLLTSIYEYIALIFGDVIFQLSGGLGVLVWILSLKFGYLEIMISIFFISLAIIVAPFRIWQKERSKKIEMWKQLKEFTKNKTDFDFQHKIAKILLPENHEEMINTLKDARDEYSSVLHINSKYKEELNKYITEFESYELLYDHLYKVDLDIINTGFTYDEKINITIENTEDIKFLYQINTPIKPEKPSMFPSISNIYGQIPFISPLNSISDKFRTVHERDENLIKVTLRELSVKDIATLIIDGFYIHSTKETFELHITISSKNTRTLIKKIIKINTKNISEITLEESET